jgi:hypothetical protein
MLQVSCGGTVPEGEIRGSRNDLQTLAQAIRTGNSTLVCSTTGCAHPYGRLLEKIVVQVSLEETPRICVAEDSSELEIRGDQAGLSIIANNIEGLARDGDEGAHWHVEHIPEEPYVAAGSYPITISLEVGCWPS